MKFEITRDEGKLRIDDGFCDKHEIFNCEDCTKNKTITK